MLYTTITSIDFILSVGSILLACIFTIIVKKILKNYKRPNGKKGGIISLHATIAFSIATIIALTTKDWYLTGLTVILAYLIARGRLDERQHYMYQVILGAIVGITVPSTVFYLYFNKMYPKDEYSREDTVREEYEDKPANASDERNEADLEPDLKLEDL